MNHIINQEIINQIQLNYDNIPLAVFLLGTNGSGKSSLHPQKSGAPRGNLLSYHLIWTFKPK
ncbi:MAG: hypothetical protein K2X04_03485, partial [Burkholderiales bacterium]|nr:hypothetical protein [Burkholderiales bacterium]